MVDELGEREKNVVLSVVREYIASGLPVGSSQLVKSSGFDFSTATLRNVMADLEELGFLEKPHTSAGRVPTHRAYRFYVDSLVRLKEPGSRDRELIQQGLSIGANVEDAVHEAGRVLHFLTRHAGIVLQPRPSAGVFHRIEFVRLKQNRVLAILVSSDGQVQNRPVQLDFPVTPEELVHASNFLSELLRETPLEDVRASLQTQMDRDQADYDAMAQKALKLGYAAADLPANDKVVIEGTGSFLDAPEFADVERMRGLFRALEEKNRLIALLDRVQRAREMQIFIGSESDFSAAGDVTVIATPYGTPERSLGTVGVIGPTRMNYSRIIPVVQFTAQVLSRVLDSK